MRRRHYSVLGMHNRSKRYACVYLVSVLLTFKHSMHGDKLVAEPPPTRKLACLESLFWRVFWPENPQDGEFSRTGKLARVQVKTQKLMRVSWRVQVAHNPVLVVTVDTVKALKCWFDIVYIYIYIYIYTCIPEETCWMAFKLWTLNSCWKVDTEKLSHNQI